MLKVSDITRKKELNNEDPSEDPSKTGIAIIARFTKMPFKISSNEETRIEDRI